MDVAKLDSSFATLETGTLWRKKTPAGKDGYADANPGEAQKLVDYVDAIVGGATPNAPVLATPTGQGIAGIIEAGLAAAPAPPVATLPVWSLTITPNWNNGQDANDVKNNYNAVWSYGKSTETYAPPNGKDVYRILLLDPRSTDAHGKAGVDEWWFAIRRGWPASYDPAKHGAWADGMNAHNVASQDGGGGGVGWGFGSGVSAFHLGWYPGDPAPSLRSEYAPPAANKILLPVPTRGVVHTYLLRFVAGRTDGTTVRQGEIELYADGALVKKFTGIDTIQKAVDPATGKTWVQRWMTIWDGDYTKDLPVPQSTLFSLTGVGRNEASALAEIPVKVTDTLSVQKYRGSGQNDGAPTLALVA